MLKAVGRETEKLGVTCDPKKVVCDFELAAINAVAAVLGTHVQVQGCFYHLCQSTWRKIQELGLAAVYMDNREVQHFVGMIDGLAFLPVGDVVSGMTYLRENVPHLSEDVVDKLNDLLDYFDATYVNGPTRSVNRVGQSSRLRLKLRRSPPMFPPAQWNVGDSTLTDGIRTNNECESWNNAFRQLVGHSHPSVWVAIEAIQMDEAMASTAMLQTARGQPPAKRVLRAFKTHQERLSNLCKRMKEGDIGMGDFLSGLGHIVRLN